MSLVSRTAQRASRRSTARNFSMLESLESRILLSGFMTPTFKRYVPPAGITPFATSSPFGVTPATMRKAYAVDVALFGSIIGDGTGQTIAIVDAFDLPTAATDLAAFDAFFGLPAPPSFTKVSQATGVAIPPADAKGGWGVEIALDIEWAHVMAPKASILLVEATDNSDANLYAAVDRARNFAGVSVVSMSWGGDETSTDTTNDSHFTTPTGHIPVTFLASSGDAGRYSDTTPTKVIVGYPAASTKVVAVGGTLLTTGTGGVYVSEAGWGSGTSSGSSTSNGGSGGGLSSFIAQPSYQVGTVTQSTTKRALPDVSLDADPGSGVPVYDVYDYSAAAPWDTIGGTSLAAPMWAGVIAIANQGRVINGLTTLEGFSQTLPKLYALPAADFHDITTGNNGYAASAGFDLVTGRGTPIVNKLVVDLAAPPGPSIGAFTINPGTTAVGTTVALTATNVVESGGTISGVKFYQETDGTSGLNTTTDTLLGNGTSSGTTFTFSFSTAALSNGTYTFYAVATDAASATITASALLTLADPVISSTLLAWDVNGQTNFGTQGLTSSPTGASDSNSLGLTRATGVTLSGTAASNAWGGTNWSQTTSTAGITASQYVSFGLTVAQGYVLSLASIAMNARHSNSGPKNGYWQYQINGGTWTLIGDFANQFTSTSGAPITPIDLSGIAGLQNLATGTVVNIRVVPYGATTSGGTWYVTNLAGNDLVVTGSSIALTGITPTGNLSLSKPAAGTYAVSTTGPIAITSDLSAQGTINLTIGANTQTDIHVTQHLSSLTIAAGATASLAEAVSAVLDLQSLTIASTGTLNLGNSTLIVSSSTLLTLRNLLKNGQIVSSLSTGTSPLNSLQYLRGSDYLALYGAGSLLGGQPVQATDLVVTFNKTGDATFDNTLNVDDYLQVEHNLFFAPTNVTSLTGDFNFDGVIDAADLAMLDAAFNHGTTINPAAFPSSTAAAINVAIGKVPTATGPISTNVSVINFGTTIYTGPLNVINTITRIRNGANISGDSNDGSVFSNNQLLLPTNAGTYYEFQVAPSTGTNMNFSTIAAPGPMRLVLAASGDLYFTGDHYVTFVPVYLASSTTPPTIGSFSLTPSSITPGVAVTLNAGGVVANSGTLTSLKFYRESNGTSGLQTATDTLVGTGASSGTTFTFTASTTGLAAGTYTYYALATDSGGRTTSASTTLTIVTPTPVIGTFTINPASITVGGNTTLTATGVTEAGGSIASLTFYRESNGTSGLQTATDTLVGTGTSSGTTFTFNFSSTGLAAGTYTFYALATDASGLTVSSSATLTIATIAPVIGGFTSNPSSITVGGSTILTATGVTEAGGSIASVNFYRESNSTTGLQTATDTLVGTGTSSGTTFTFNFDSTGLAAGSYTFYALATDAAANTISASATLSITTAGSTNTLLAWDVNGQTNFGTQGLAATTAAASDTNSLTLTRGTGILTTGSATASAWGGFNFATTSAAGITANEFVTFGLTVAPGYVLSISSLDMTARHSASGPVNGYWQYQINNGAWTLIGDFTNQFTSTTGAAISTMNLAGIAALQNLSSGTAVNIRVTPYGGTASGGTWYVFSSTGNDLLLSGSSASLTGLSSLANIILSSTTPGTYTVHTTGPLTISTDLSLQGNITLDVGTNSAITLSSTQHFAALTIGAGATVLMPAGLGSLLDLQTLTINATGKLDIANNLLDLHASDLLTLRGLLKNGQLYSSLAASTITAVGYLLGSQFTAINAPGSTFAGQSVAANDLLIRYTYIGDTNLDGQLNYDDVLQADDSALMPPTTPTWFTGDFNNDGTIDLTDINMLLTAYPQAPTHPL